MVMLIVLNVAIQLFIMTNDPLAKKFLSHTDTMKAFRKQIRDGYQLIVIFTGMQRSGKTATAMRFAYELDQSWTPDLMSFKIDDLVDLFSKNKHKIIIFDEAGVSLDPLQHLTLTQIVYKHIIQTQAYRQNHIFLCLPYAIEIGKAHRNHVQWTVNIRRYGNKVFYDTRKIMNRHDDLSFRPPYRYHLESAGAVPLPPKHIWEPYINKNQQVYKESIMTMQKNLLEARAKKNRPKPKPVLLTHVPTL